MKYTKPLYEIEKITTSDIVLTSSGAVDLGNGASLTQVDSNTANVSVSIFDVLGRR